MVGHSTRGCAGRTKRCSRFSPPLEQSGGDRFVPHSVTRRFVRRACLATRDAFAFGAAGEQCAEDAPETVRLVFSEAVVPELSQIALVRRDAQRVIIDSVRLPVANDPHDVHTLIGTVSGLRPVVIP